MLSACKVGYDKEKGTEVALVYFWENQKTDLKPGTAKSKRDDCLSCPALRKCSVL
ncbi:hypothetical protein KIS1582_4795 [Cytobacillus firmus]|uniref:Uncharacterized protein n=1 Tax=Cytobacillus firmus TaxID=1399 RepID=A0A800N857_CYTFI|nr:hypothetical protein KIS1582_4795 [Cytobacillus firmus]